MAELALDVAGLPALIKRLFPDEEPEYTESYRAKMVNRVRKWQERQTSQLNSVEFFERLKFELDISEVHIDLSPWTLAGCSAVEFLHLLPEAHRRRVQSMAPPGDPIRRLADVSQPAPAEAPETWLNTERAHRHLRAGLDMLERVDRRVREGSGGASWNEEAWWLCGCLKAYLDRIHSDPEAVVLIVGPKAEGGTPNFDWPVFSAAVGRTTAHLDGAHKDALTLFLDPETGKFPDPPPLEAPIGERRNVDTGLILVAWRAGDSAKIFADEEPVDFDGCEGRHCEKATRTIRNQAQFRDMYLELSRETETVHLFRIAKRGARERIVVAFDFLDDVELSEYECAFILNAVHRVFVNLTSGGTDSRGRGDGAAV
jgi:hypothetical protein